MGATKGFKYEMKINANVTEATTGLEQLRKQMANVLDAKAVPGLDKVLSSIGTSIDSVRSKAATPIKTDALFNSMIGSATKTVTAVDRIGEVLQELKTTTDASKKLSILSVDTYEKLMTVVKGIDNIDEATKKAKNSLLAQTRAIQAQQTANQTRVATTKAASEAINEEGHTLEKQKDIAAENLKNAEKQKKRVQEATVALEEQRKTVAALSEALEKKKKAEGIDVKEKDVSTAKEALAAAQAKVQAKQDALATEKARPTKDKADASSKGGKVSGLKKELKKEQAAYDAAYDSLIKDIQEKEAALAEARKTSGSDGKTVNASEKELSKAQQKQSELESTSQEATASEAEMVALQKAASDTAEAFRNANAEYRSAQTEQTRLKKQLEDVNAQLANLEKNPAPQAMTDLAAAARKAASENNKVANALAAFDANGTVENFNALRDAMQQMVDDGIVEADEKINKAIQTQGQLKTAVLETKDEIEKENTAFKKQSEAANEVNGLMNRIKQFTGLTGAALVARRALRNAISTIKELDKQMTAMAVVTNLEVGDYWKQLPEHTERANALGMAIKDVYEAETLYYQQGLKTAQVTQLSTSTLKMARIAGLSAEDATNKMTAALRGFNMEINQTNADRIADVYSKLAAITASNVQEISSAMTKTASLAANAGMQFETTAALLSQIIN